MGKVKLQTSTVKPRFISYQFPMGKVKVVVGSVIGVVMAYQFPMGKVKVIAKERIANPSARINPLWER